MGKFIEKSLKEGTLVDTGGLLPSKDGFRVELHHQHWPAFDGECEVRPMFAPGEGP